MLINAGCWRKKELHRKLSLGITGKTLAWENSRHLAKPTTPGFSTKWHLRNERRNSQILVVPLIGRAAWEICFNQSEALFRSGKWHVISMEFLRSFLRRYFAGKPTVSSPISRARKTVLRQVLIIVCEAVMPPLKGLKAWKWRLDII